MWFIIYHQNKRSPEKAGQTYNNKRLLLLKMNRARVENDQMGITYISHNNKHIQIIQLRYHILHKLYIEKTNRK